MPRLDTQQIDLSRSIDFDKEQFLNDMVDSMRTTREEFERLYILEEFPIEVTLTDYSDFKKIDTEYVFSTKQEFQIRRKTTEEMLGEITHIITAGGLVKPARFVKIGDI